MSSTKDLRAFEDGSLYLFTSLTAGSSHIITATSRLETILKANKIPFQAIDMATDEHARRLWQRRAQKKKLPGLVKDGYVIGDLEEIEEWNEFGELAENIGDVRPATARPGVNIRPVDASAAATLSTSPRQSEDHRPDIPHPNASETASALVDSKSRIALPGAAEIAERFKGKSKSAPEVKTAPAVGEEGDAAASPPIEGGDGQKRASFAGDEARDGDVAKEGTTPVTTDAEVPGVEASAGTSSMTGKEEGASDAALESAKPLAMTEDATAALQAEAQTETADTASAPAVSEGVAEDESKKTHRGSDVQAASPEEVKRVESENVLPEDPAEDAVEEAMHRVESIRFDDEPAKPID